MPKHYWLALFVSGMANRYSHDHHQCGRSMRMNSKLSVEFQQKRSSYGGFQSMGVPPVIIHRTFPFSHLLSIHSWGYPNDFGNLHISSNESSSYPRPGSPVQVSRLRLDALSAPDQQQWNIVFKCVGTSIKDYEGDMWVVFCGAPIRQETQTLGRMKKVNGTCPVTLKNHMRW